MPFGEFQNCVFNQTDRPQIEIWFGAYSQEPNW